MNSRDRLSHNPIRYAVEDQLEEMLKQHQGLRALKEKRRSEEIQSKLADEKPLEDILISLMEHSPTLSALFLQGKRAVNPFKTLQVKEREKEFEGKKHPTYFKFQDKEYGKELRRECHIDQRCRIVFETDAVNDYFSRNVDPGEFSLFLVSEVGRFKVSDYVGPNLQNGLATLTVQLPANCKVGDLLRFQAVVTDPTKLDPFENTFSLDVKQEAVAHGGGSGDRHKPPTKEEGEDREVPTGISLPNIVPIYEADWLLQTPPFDKYSALRIGITDAPSNGEAETGNGESHDVYDFKINMDNLFLKSELKAGADQTDMIRARWKYGLVLIGLALLHDENQAKKARAETEDTSPEEENGDSVESRVERFTRAIAPVLLPMINSLGALELEEALGAVASGEAT